MHRKEEKMAKLKNSLLIRVATAIFIILGIILTTISAFYVSSFLAILGVALIFWGVILLYIAPTKQVPLELVMAAAEPGTQNIQRIIEQYHLSQQAIYLSPKNLQKVESSLIFIPQKPQTPLPQPEENNQQFTNTEHNGVFITPPGLSLSKLFEKHIGTSFARIDIYQIQKILPRLLIKDMEIAESVEIEMDQNTITIYLIKNILNPTNQEQNQSSANNQIGNLLSSAIACILAKATRKPITIKQETYDKKTKTTTLIYQMQEG
jgi:hypothetical protein